MQHELLKEARTIVEERRSSVVLGIKGEPNREGVFQWVEGPPTAGKPAVLAYNANSGPLRNAQVPTSKTRKDHAARHDSLHSFKSVPSWVLS